MQSFFDSPDTDDLFELARAMAVNEAVFKSLDANWQSSFRGVKLSHWQNGKPKLLLDLQRNPYLASQTIELSISHHGSIIVAVAISNPIKFYRKILVKFSSSLQHKSHLSN